MGEAFGQMLPAAVGAALSPFPIIAVVLMLVTPRGKMNGAAFVLGWALGLAVIGAVVLSVADDVDASENGAPADWVSWVTIGLGGILILLAARQWQARPAAGEETPAPKWMSSVDHFTPVKALGLGILLSALNPKNLVLSLSAAAIIASAGVSSGDEVLLWIVFMAIASLGVLTPVAISLLMGDRSAEVLDSLKGWLAHNNAVIMFVLLAIIGLKLIGDGISGLSA